MYIQAIVLRISIALLVCLSLCPALVRAEQPMNIVLLFADDWRHDTLGVAGNPVVQTPHLDQLANRSVRFTQNCVTTSICGVSRATLLTGQWMSAHGCRGFTMFETDWEDTFVSVLRSHGYHVGHVGKWHNGRFPKEQYDFGTAYHGKHWYNVDGERMHVTARNDRDALKFLNDRPRDKPFCLVTSFFAPHAEDNSPEQYLPQPWSESLYEGVTIPRAENATEESWERLPPFFNEQNEGRARWRKRFDESAKYQRMMTNYYRLVSEVDSVCGKILAELDRQGIRDNTLVIFTADNGYYHAEHGLADKWYPHQESIRVPLMIDDPRLPESRQGTTDEHLTLNVDLAPTILAAAGLPIPATMQGTDIAPLYLDASPPEWRTDYYYEHPTIRDTSFIPTSEALVTPQYKYMVWPEHKYEQLFDLKDDPQEEHDLASDPEQQQRLTEMRQRFAELKAKAQKAP
ncbi:sulfatase family protein [Aeoliella mucimassa]|uniref:Arylsulfatase n=1 Tax=Aeoliella mucimassa TaxID=2527972 RepID=A0A518AV65_9BACT|nr:sulfatase [Aeoliella mucimassa]QDU58611.1 Arylsulfatase [Aeoliella mucimassa]